MESYYTYVCWLYDIQKLINKHLQVKKLLKVWNLKTFQIVVVLMYIQTIQISAQSLDCHNLSAYFTAYFTHVRSLSSLLPTKCSVTKLNTNSILQLCMLIYTHRRTYPHHHQLVGYYQPTQDQDHSCGRTLLGQFV